SATASSGLPVSFTASGNATVQQVGGVWTVHITRAGSATITAHQAGDSSYDAAADVSQSFKIGQASPVLSITGLSTTYDGNGHAATGTATGVESPNPVNLNSGLHLGYSTDGGHTFSTSAPINAGTYEVYYTFAGNANYLTVSSETDTGKQVAIS